MKYLGYTEDIKEVALMLLNLRIIPSKELGYIVVHHPFTNSIFSCSNEGSILDLSENKDKEKWVSLMTDIIKDKRDFFGICNIICKPYRLTFLKYCLPYLDNEDIARFLKNEWVSIEFPNYDSAFSTKELVNLFGRCSKENLMTENELKVYNNLPSEVTVYRGVRDVNKNNKHALSWALDKSIAEWFANRFGSKGIVLERKISKDKILCYFSNEKECIVDTY